LALERNQQNLMLLLQFKGQERGVMSDATPVWVGWANEAISDHMLNYSASKYIWVFRVAS
jgi:hypothetical protein